MHIFPQDEHETLLIEALERAGVRVERGAELAGFSETADGVLARLRLVGGEDDTCQARFIAGCDGAHSVVRKAIGVGFPGGAYRRLFYVADVEAEGPAINGELNVDLDEADFLAVFPLAGEGRARLVGTVRDERAEKADGLRFEDVSGRAIESLKLVVRKVNWFSTYRVHHRVTDQFRKGRAFLLGDAAHIHSPAGGQGMNTGVGDAVNLAWKLAAVIQGRAPDRLLDSYEAERISFARRLVATTDRGFSFVTAEGPVAGALRTRVAPLVLSAAVKLDAVRDFIFRTISQISLHYRGGPLSAGQAGGVRGGDRLPWVAVAGEDNFAPLPAIGWQVHVYGLASSELTGWCDQSDVALRVFAWRPEHGSVGLMRNAIYLLRPDTYIALAAPTPALNALRDFAARHELTFGCGVVSP